ncbi:hypothetical protein VTJ04DRAFT_3168 [Mycothermus thermophilus]|uniref:uncharacterized protein n=1 Tax=Humicola insolens TaxID=85995 RepID=UPI0037443B1D
MPSRKSDARRSDVSTARFVLADDDNSMATDPPAPAPAPAAATKAAPEPAAQGTTQQSGEKKEKEKEKDKDGPREKEKDTVTIEDLALPKSIITRLAKGVLPQNTQIQANAILALTKSATVFVNHLANAANEFTVNGGKKTIMPSDVFNALDSIEFGFMRERVEAEFKKFHEIQSSKRSTYRKKVAAAKKAAKAGEAGQSADADTSMVSTGAGDDSTVAGDVTAASATTSSAKSGTAAARSGGSSSSAAGRAAKKARLNPADEDGSKMQVDGEEGDGEEVISDAETVPEEEEEEEEEEDGDEEEEEEEEDEEEDNEERDELEEREEREDEDEALDEDSD